jgi:hypothetical protein
MQQRIRNPKGCRITLYLQLVSFTLKQNGKDKFQFLVTNGGRSLAAPVTSEASKASSNRAEDTGQGLTHQRPT